MDWDREPGTGPNDSTEFQVYARWEAKTYRVGFNLGQGGSMPEIDALVYVDATFGQAMPTGANIIAPVRQGFRFAGFWTTLVVEGQDGVEHGVQYYDAQMNSTKNWDRDITTTLHARWIASLTQFEAPTVTVRFDTPFSMGDNARGFISITEFGVVYGEHMPTAHLDASHEGYVNQLQAPTKAGYKFVGYEYNGVRYYDSNMNSVRESNITRNGAIMRAVFVPNTNNTIVVIGIAGGVVATLFIASLAYVAIKRKR
jgi:hypothetical protein